MTKVRESCGFLVGVLLHRDLGEEPCTMCRLRTETLTQPLRVTEREAAQHREVLAAATGAGKTRRPMGTGYDFPVLN